jgi:hypothetical protein
MIETSPLIGFVDVIDTGRVSGWIWDKSQPERRLTVSISVAGRTVGTTEASLLRPDLAEAGIGDGRHAFHFAFESTLPDGEADDIKAHSDGFQIPIGSEVRRLIPGGLIADRASQNKNNPMLRREHIANCRIFTDRLAMMKALAPRHGIGAELGIWNGDFSALLLTQIEPVSLHLVDSKIRDEVKRRFSVALDGPFLKVHEGDSATVLLTFPDEYFDWIYIDGDHSYDGVSRDAEVSIKKLKRDGILFFNDYTMGDHNVPNGFYPYGVIPVVNNLCLNTGFEMVGFALHVQMYCDVAIKRVGGV